MCRWRVTVERVHGQTDSDGKSGALGSARGHLEPPCSKKTCQIPIHEYRVEQPKMKSGRDDFTTYKWNREATLRLWWWFGWDRWRFPKCLDLTRIKHQFPPNCCTFWRKTTANKNGREELLSITTTQKQIEKIVRGDSDLQLDRTLPWLHDGLALVAVRKPRKTATRRILKGQKEWDKKHGQLIDDGWARVIRAPSQVDSTREHRGSNGEVWLLLPVE